MARRAATTLVLITRQTLVRADFAGGKTPALLHSWQQPRLELDDAAALVEAALALGPKPGRQVFVLSSDFWSQTLAFPASRTAGLAEEELTGALNFEAEPLSGLSAFDSVIGKMVLKAAPGETLYWIIQLRSADRDRVDDVVRKAGGRLAGLGHPGGLPAPLYPFETAAVSWERVELWPDAVVFLHGDDKGLRDIHFLNIDPRQGRWQSAVEKLRAQAGTTEHREILAAENLAAAVGPLSQAPLQLDKPAGLEQWLTAWAAQVTQRQTDVPVVRPLARPMSQALRNTMAAMVALVTAGICAAHFHYMIQPTAADLRAELAEAQKPKQAYDDMAKQIKELEKKRDTVGKQDYSLFLSNETLARQRKRLAELLRFVAECCCEDVVVQKIASGAGEPRIHGMCLRPELADQFAHKLSQALEAQDWEVELVRKQALILQTDGAPWAFELHIKERIYPGAAGAPGQGDPRSMSK